MVGLGFGGYLQKHRADIWLTLRKSSSFGKTDLATPVRYVYNNAHIDDDTILRYKTRIKGRIRVFKYLSVLAGLAVLALVVVSRLAWWK
jgi:hypothetical protein